MSLKPVPEGPLRTGYTTGACATACAKAALLALLRQETIEEVEIILPAGEKVIFTIKSCQFSNDSATCTTIKDAGDDPDVTHRAEIGCRVSFNESMEIRFVRGEGVGVVTLPGLALSVGEPAINPVPRDMMKNAINFVLHQHRINKGVDVEVFVKNGKELAKRTLNSRVGIMDGLSILGTTGIVRPFSASAYIASIVQGIDVAVANGCEMVVINSGGRSENILKSLFPELPDYAFIQYGNWIGETLEKVGESGLRRLTIGIMLGKAVKLAQGELDTHSGRSTWDKHFVCSLAREAGYTEKECEKIFELNMARRLTEIFKFDQKEPFYKKLCQYVYRVCSSKLPGVELDILLLDANDNIITYSEKL